MTTHTLTTHTPEDARTYIINAFGAGEVRMRVFGWESADTRLNRIIEVVFAEMVESGEITESYDGFGTYYTL